MNTPGMSLDHQERLAVGEACAVAALSYLQLGLVPLQLCDPDHIGVKRINPAHVHSCLTPGKQPLRPWKHLQSTFPSVTDVQRWWTAYPIGNVGMVCGQISGAVRIDTDGEAGTQLLHAWSQSDLPETWMFQSPANGRQRLYAWPHETPCKTVTQAAPGSHNELRLIGNGHQTVLPPSRHPAGGQYTWLPGYSPMDRTLAPAPAWLIARMQGHARETTVPASHGPADPDLVKAALAALPNDDVDYDTWLAIGMALHSTGEAWAEALWTTWSQQSTKYREKKQHKSWESFDANGGVTLGTLFHLAKEAGWRSPVETQHTQQESVRMTSGTLPRLSRLPTLPTLGVYR
jgi:hypothetical protein